MNNLSLDWGPFAWCVWAFTLEVAFASVWIHVQVWTGYAPKPSHTKISCEKAPWAYETFSKQNYCGKEIAQKERLLATDRWPMHADIFCVWRGKIYTEQSGWKHQEALTLRHAIITCIFLSFASLSIFGASIILKVLEWIKAQLICSTRRACWNKTPGFGWVFSNLWTKCKSSDEPLAFTPWVPPKASSSEGKTRQQSLWKTLKILVPITTTWTEEVSFSELHVHVCTILHCCGWRFPILKKGCFSKKPDRQPGLTEIYLSSYSNEKEKTQWWTFLFVSVRIKTFGSNYHSPKVMSTGNLMSTCHTALTLSHFMNAKSLLHHISTQKRSVHNFAVLYVTSLIFFVGWVETWMT